MSVISLSSRVGRIVGIFTVALVAAIPLLTLANESKTVMTLEGQKLFTNPILVQILLFGTTYAAIGEMVTSFACSIGIMQIAKLAFTHKGGKEAKRYFTEDVVKGIQENVFSITNNDL